MVKRLPNWLKIGVQAGFGPNFTVEFEAAIPKKFGLAYYTGMFELLAKGLQVVKFVFGKYK